MIRTALIGLGKMGLSHLAMVRTCPQVQLEGVCDPSAIVLDALRKYTDIPTYKDYRKLLTERRLDAVVVATPSRFHGDIVRLALENGIHVFCEKPFCLDPEEGRALADLAERKGLVNQVGYHYRFVGAFQEAHRLLSGGALGQVHHIRGEAFGPVVLRRKSATWRSSKSEGGGCLYDYASHVIDLMNYLVGPPTSITGSTLNRIFSRDVDDEVYSTFHYHNGASGQLAANWSDESNRKMSVKISVWGDKGRMQCDRQELQVYLSDAALAQSAGLRKGWNLRYTTELTQPVWYYLRGEEYAAQIAHFVQQIADGAPAVSTFRTAAETDRIINDIRADATALPAARQPQVAEARPAGPPRPWRLRSLLHAAR